MSEQHKLPVTVSCEIDWLVEQVDALPEDAKRICLVREPTGALLVYWQTDEPDGKPGLWHRAEE